MEGYQPRPFGCEVGSQFHHRPRFPRPPVSSRTVEFLESGWRSWPIPRQAFPRPSRLKCRPTYTPHGSGLPAGSTSPGTYRVLGLNVPARVHSMPTMHREPLCPFRVLPLRGWRLPPPRKALPFPHRSYGLMRQTNSLPLTSALTSLSGSLQVAASPCWESALPDVISASLSPGAWTPTPVGPYGAFARFFP